ncbi:MAG: S8 family serine peptidase [Planctomycetota bacterium]
MTRPACCSALLSLAFLLTGGAAFPLAAASEIEPGQIHLAQFTFDPLVGLPDLAPHLTRGFPAPGESAVYLVQFDGVITVERRQMLERCATVLGYVPDNAFLVESSWEAVRALPLRWAGLWHPGFKLSPEIGRHGFLDPLRATDPLLTLFVWTHGDPEVVRVALEVAGAAVVEWFERSVGQRFVVKADDETLLEIAALDPVLWIEEKPECYLLNDKTTWVAQSNVSGQFPIWDHGIQGENQFAVVMDTGLDYNSCWFRDPGKTPGANHRKVIYYKNYGGRAYDGCSLGHGTHVCGTLAGNQTYVNPGATHANGLAPQAKLGMQDVGYDDFFSCLLGLVWVPSDLTAAFLDAYNSGGHVHSNSWGSTSNSYDSYCVDIDDFLWSHQDFLILFANGNSGPGSGTVGSPATAKNCVSVGATKQAPNQEQLASYSSRGPASDGRTKPTVALPGGDDSGTIVSADNDPGNPPANTCNSVGYAGTSMATPATSGCALLVRQYYTDGFYPSGAATPADAFVPSGALIKASLINGARDIGTANIPNNDEGWGRVLLDDVLYFDGDTRELRVEDESPGLVTGGSATYDYEVEAGEALEIVLVWADYPATAGSGRALINNLDLTVTGPTGTYKGNVFSGGQSVTGGSYDSLNVEEVVRLNNPAAGTYTVRVGGTNVPHGPQPFALASTGRFANWPEGCETPASWTNYGAGLAGTLGIPGLAPDSNPVLGSTITLNVGNSLGATTPGAFLIGFSAASLPGFGGIVLVDPAIIVTVVIPGAGLAAPGDIPADPGLCGLHLYLQVLESDPGAVQDVSMTPGLELVLGS